MPSDHPPAGWPVPARTFPQAVPPRGGRRRSGLVIVAAVVGAGLAVGGILRATGDGAGDGDPRRQAYVDAIASTADSEEIPGMDAIALRCVAGAIVDGIGAHQLATEVTPDDIRNHPADLWDLLPESTEAEASEIADDMFACWDVRATLLDQLLEDGSDPAAVRCLQDRLTDDPLRNLFVDLLLLSEQQAQSNFRESMAPIMSACGL